MFIIRKTVCTHLIIVVLFVFPSCINKKCSYQVISQSKEIPLYIEMPQNKLVFQNMAPLVYDVLWNHFKQVGFKLVDSQKDCYALRVVIKQVDSSYKFLSPDLLTYAVRMKLELLCQLFDNAQKICMQKQFTFSSLISKPQEHIENSKFTDFEYRRLLQRQVHKIDQYFRPFLSKSV